MASKFSHNQTMNRTFATILFLSLSGFPAVQASDWKPIPEAADENARLPAARQPQSESDLETEEEKVPAGAKLVSGVVRFSRSMPETEVFLKDVKDSVFIAKNDSHNSILEACEVSRKNRSPVQLIVDSKSRYVVRLATEKEVKAAAEAALAEAKAKLEAKSKTSRPKPDSKASPGTPGSK